jgi:uncharacterized protein YndB with AHSA1/START domain
MSVYDWSKFVLRIPVNAPLETIYHAWATQKGIEAWFLRSARYFSDTNTLREENEFIQKGDRYTWLWHGYDDDTVEHNDILEANGTDELSFVFAGHCVVTVSIGMLDTETVVELTQENIPTGEEGKADIHIGCMEGWTFYLANLKSILEGGLDLRNRNMNIGKVINS